MGLRGMCDGENPLSHPPRRSAAPRPARLRGGPGSRGSSASTQLGMKQAQQGSWVEGLGQQAVESRGQQQRPPRCGRARHQRVQTKPRQGRIAPQPACRAQRLVVLGRNAHQRQRGSMPMRQRPGLPRPRALHHVASGLLQHPGRKAAAGPIGLDQQNRAQDTSPAPQHRTSDGRSATSETGAGSLQVAFVVRLRPPRPRPGAGAAAGTKRMGKAIPAKALHDSIFECNPSYWSCADTVNGIQISLPKLRASVFPHCRLRPSRAPFHDRSTPAARRR